MLKSDYIRREHENTLLLQGFICVKEEYGVQTWADMQGTGSDILHLVSNYPLYVDEFGALSPGDAERRGAIYFLIDRGQELRTAWVSRAIAFSRSE